MTELIIGADIGRDQVGFPTVIKAAGRLADPIDDWYLWCAPHDTPGGMFLFTAPEATGPWTLYDPDPVLATPSPHRHISSPYILWDPDRQVLQNWAHLLHGAPDDTQDTHLWESVDGITWTWENGHQPVLPLGSGSDLDTGNATYMNVCRYDGKLYGYYQGSSLVSGAHICEATSLDGVTWTKTSQAGGHKSWNDPAGDTSQKPHPIVLGGRLFVIYMGRFSTTTRTVLYYRERLGDGSFGPKRKFGMQDRADGWDSGQISPGDMVWDGSKFVFFYTGNPAFNASVGDSVGMAVCAFPHRGFDTSRGKG